jgi:hypothetical protein
MLRTNGDVLMIWYSKKPPQYIFLEDQWEREEDHKLFYPINFRWVSRDGEYVDFGKKSLIMKYREKNETDGMVRL